MNIDYALLAKRALDGSWQYNPLSQQLRHYFGDTQSLTEWAIIDSEGCLVQDFKDAVYAAIGDELLDSIKGAFDDEDIFCGVVVEDNTEYYIEVYGVDNSSLAAWRAKLNIDIADN